MTQRADEPFSVEIFVVDADGRCKHHVDRLRALFDENGESQDGLTVVDLDEEPERALSDDILAIPTILRRAPPPERRVIGDMTESERVWRLLRR